MVGAIIIYVGFRASLPTLEGTVETTGISDGVALERDARGHATLISANRNDLSFATGYLHAQERFFQMDLSRRLASGELSELFGSAALGVDRENRIHRFRHRASVTVDLLPVEHKKLLEQYVLGVNAGLADLGSKPFEYWLLSSEPRKWNMEDSVLVIYSMFFTLQDSGGGYEWQNHLIRKTLDPQLADFLLPLRTEWDAPIQEDAEPIIKTEMPKAVVINTKQVSSLVRDDQPMLGSNNWAVSGALTRNGAAMLSNDMHLSIRAPSIWYKLRLKLIDGSLDITGVSLPGTPAIIAGSNGSVAWGFTNSNIDTSDVIKLNINPDNANQYLTADGYKDFNIFEETISAKGSSSETITVRETIWGPVMDLQNGETHVFRWVPHVPGSVSMGLINMETVSTVEEAQSIAGTIGIPAQNAMLVDKNGNMGWTIFGMVPRRSAGDYHKVMDWSDGQSAWDGWYGSEEYPKVYNPEDNRLWTANARVVTGMDLELLGYSRYDLGARAKQIKDGLFKLEGDVVENDLYEIMLDNEAIFLSRWQEQLVSVLKNSEDDAFGSYLYEVENWGGRADKNSVGFRLVRDYRHQVYESLMGNATATCEAYNEGCNYGQATKQWEAPLWKLVNERPQGWLPEGFDDWQFFLEKQAFDAWNPVIVGEFDLKQYTWGERNKTEIRHPLSGAVPLLGKLTNMQDEPQSGDTENMPHISGRVSGQSERIVVSPGFEENGIMNLPAGQSGHPLSPYYGAGHTDWVNGIPTPFLPQDTVWKLEFKPTSN